MLRRSVAARSYSLWRYSRQASLAGGRSCIEYLFTLGGIIFMAADSHYSHFPRRRALSFLVAVASVALATSASAQLLINEIFFDPGGAALDVREEFIELRGPAGMSLENHYLVFLENELDQFGVGDAGVIENLFDLGVAGNGSPATIGSNGFLAIRQSFDRYNSSQINPAATQLINDGPLLPGGFPAAFPGYGNDADQGSTVGHADLPSTGGSASTGALENSGFTAFLIRVDPELGDAPVLGVDLDEMNDGLDVPTGQVGWTILDSIGVFGEAGETEFGRLYAATNFGSGDPSFFAPDFEPNIEPGAEFTILNYEIEYIGRWGNSTGSALEDWHASNLTDNEGSGSRGVNSEGVDFRQSFTGSHSALASGSDSEPPSQPTPSQGELESSQGVPYGTPILTNIGGPNFILGDFNADGQVNAADYTVFRDTEGETATELSQLPADVNRDFDVDADDLAIWAARFGAPNATPVLSSVARIPEPTSLALFAVGIGFAAQRRRAW